MPENSTPMLHQPHVDRRDPFVISVRESERRPGAMRTVRRAAPAPAGLSSDLIGVPEGAPLVLDLRLESVTEGVLVTGTLVATRAGECGRCLDPVHDEFVAELCELFVYPDSATDETSEWDEVDRIVDELIDLEPLVRDVIVLGLPMTPLCRPDCRGLCPTCGQRVDDLPASHTHETLDPRWASLRSYARNSEI
jgi:uncharacterized protein